MAMVTIRKEKNMSVGEYICVGRIYVIINEANDKLTIEQIEETKVSLKNILLRIFRIITEQSLVLLWN